MTYTIKSPQKNHITKKYRSIEKPVFLFSPKSTTRTRKTMVKPMKKATLQYKIAHLLFVLAMICIEVYGYEFENELFWNRWNTR